LKSFLIATTTNLYITCNLQDINKQVPLVMQRRMSLRI